MYIILSLSIFLIFIALIKPKSQTIAISIFLFMWLLMGWNTDNADFQNYYNLFNGFSNFAELIAVGIINPGFSIINIFFKSLGFDFYQFRIIISFISLYFVYSTIRKFSIYPAFVSVCYFLFIFALDVTQFRNFIAYSIVIYAVRFLFQKGIKGIIFFSLLTLIASSIHSACLFYIILVLARLKIDLKIILLFLLIIFITKSTLYKHYSLTLNTDILFDRYHQGISTLALISIIFVQASNAIYINIYKQYPLDKSIIAEKYNYTMHKNKIVHFSNYRNIDKISEFTNSNVIPIISLFLLLLIPFYGDNIAYSRIFRNVVILNFIYISNHKLNAPFKTIPINTLLLLVYGSFFFFFYFIYATGWDFVIKPILINNSLFN